MIARDGETVYDLALRVHGDFNYLSNILSQVDDLDDPGAGYTIKKLPEAVIMPSFGYVSPAPKRPDFVAREYQSVYDLALQLYGDLNNLPDILSQVSDLTDPEGLTFKTTTTDNFLANTLFSKTIVSTSQDVTGINQGIGWMIIEDTFIVA
jgi:hypothetical protein